MMNRLSTNDVPQPALRSSEPGQLAVEILERLKYRIGKDPKVAKPHDWLTAWYLRMGRAGADVEVHRYPGAGHLYTDEGLPDHDEKAAEETWQAALGFLDTLAEGEDRT